MVKSSKMVRIVNLKQYWDLETKKWDRQAEMKRSYVLMKLDMMLAQHKSIGLIDIHDLHEFIVLFRTLDKRRQRLYAHLVDEMAELWDSFDEVDN